MYPQLIAQLKEKLISDMQDTLQQRWMDEKASDIQREVTEEVSRQKKQWARTHAASAHDIQHPGPYQKFVKFEGYMVDEDTIRYNINISEYTINQTILGKYEKAFLDDYWNSPKHNLKGLISAQYDALQPEKILDRFLARHPWLEEELIRVSRSWMGDYASLIAYRFLSPIMQTALNKLDSPRQTSWTWARVTALLAGRVTWSTLDETELKANIEGYPLSSMSSFYYTGSPQLGSAQEAIQSAQRDPREGKKLLNHSLRRVDVFRHIVQTYPGSSYSQKQRNGIDCPEMSPFIAEELTQLSAPQLARLKTMLVNIGTEKLPIWVCLHKPNPGVHNQWNVYVPASLQAEALRKLDAFKNKLNLNITSLIVDFTENAKQNNIEDLTETTMWHAVLFHRVLPWTQNKTGTLASYRHNVPVSLLLERTLTLCLTGLSSASSSVHAAFARRKPLSDTGIETLVANKNAGKHLLEDSSLYDSNDSIIIDAIDSKKFQLLPDQVGVIPDTLRIELSAYLDPTTKLDFVKQALYLAYHNQNLKKLITPNLHLDASYSPGKHIDRLLNYNTSIYTVKTTSMSDLQGTNNTLALAMSCAARNRFLSSVMDAHSWTKMSEFSMRPKIWDAAGREIVSFFWAHGSEIDLDFINAFKNQNATWSADCFDHDKKPGEPKLQAMWQFAQIAQMGTRGLDVMFQHLQSVYVNKWEHDLKEPAPNLAAVFDLSGSLNDTPKAYTKHLKEKIETIGNNAKGRNSSGCSPIFKSLSLIAPANLDSSIQYELIELFKTIDKQKKEKDPNNPDNFRYPEALSEITFYNIDIRNHIDSKAFLEQIARLARGANLQVLIRIPEWDRAAYTSPKALELKAKYNEIQDLILANQRQAKLAQLTKNTKNIHLVKEITPAIIIKEHDELKPQPWGEEENEVLYPLTAQTPGVQQQLQQAIQQEYTQEQEQEQEQEKEQEQEQEISEYKGDEGLLITRDTIDVTKSSTDHWHALPEEMKNRSGWKKGTLRQLFSLWVGSDVDAANVIKKIEPAAVKKMMEYASYFRLGASRDNLPPGFSLAFSRKDKGLILCFDERKAKRELNQLASKEYKDRNHFKVQFYDPLKSNVFRGDYRQLAPITAKAPQQKLLYKFLANTDADKQRIEGAVHALSRLGMHTSPDDAPVLMQEYTVSGMTSEMPGTREDCLLFLGEWAAKKLNPPQDVLNALFHPESPNALTEANLRAFGQLFYDHEAEKVSGGKNATDHFLVLSQQIHQAFGPKHFETWKKYILDPSRNYTELFTKDEIESVSLSIATIGHNKPFQEMWWALIEAHGKSTGFTRYGPLWESYQTLINYAEKNKLSLNPKAMIAYLEKADNFNAQVFLDRLHTVLRNCEKGMDKVAVQQNILDHLDQIDWRHNGLYYASRYENHPYWAESLALSSFNANSDLSIQSYIPKMKDVLVMEPSEQLITSYRYLSRRMMSVFDEFHKISQIIQNQFEKGDHIHTTNGPLVLRLLISCLSQGTDRINDITEEQVQQQLLALNGIADSHLLFWLNKNIDLDDKIVSGSFGLKFEHLALLIQAIKKAGLEDTVLYMGAEEAREFINSCGRALKCYSSKYVQNQWVKGATAEDALAGLLKLVTQQGLGLDSPLVTNFPWLYFEHAKSGQHSWSSPVTPTNKVDFYHIRVQQELLIQQMRSIDFTHSTMLPTYSDLTAADHKISTEHNPKKARQEFVTAQIKEGCAIMYQDAAYRPLNLDEKDQAIKYMAKHLKINFKSQNMPLVETFFHECIAVEAEGEVQNKRLDVLLKLLSSIDNKPYYNDLGQVLGLLIQSSRKHKGQQKLYSLEQLTSWLESLLDPKYMENSHYPINILTMILDLQLRDAEAEEGSSLLNANLNKLTPKINPDQLRKNIVAIVTSEKLPSKYKPVLAKYALNFPMDNNFINQARSTIEKLHAADANPSWLKGISEFIGSLESQNAKVHELREYILYQITLSATEAKVAPELVGFWEESQIKLVEMYLQKNPKFAQENIDTFEIINTPKDSYIQMILLQSITDLDITKTEVDLEQLRKKIKNLDEETFCTQADLDTLKNRLKELDPSELHQLAKYCGTEPRPSVRLLTKLLVHSEFTDVKQLIHRFETVEQGLKKPQNTPKRHYSVTEAENKDLYRVLSGLKQKGKGFVHEDQQRKLLELIYYVNNYSQVANLADLQFDYLQQELFLQRNMLLQLSESIDPEDKEKATLASARMLACMREILLRKTGKWVNHTQMLDLIYAAMHNDEKLLHQVRTGQGKSIISMMRVSYLALNGKVVDIFSSKDSLSKRDQEEFIHVLDAMKIENSYITPNSPNESYKTNDSPTKIGKVNFCTIGNSSLFQSTQIWQHIKNINLDPKLRVAFVDECDFVLKFEDTQFNYSANTGAEAIYNFDEWVYRVVHKYYEQNVTDKSFIEKDGVYYISRHLHLKELCELLQKESINAPKQSDFLAKFINPATSIDPKAIEKRDNELKKLLVASHVAQGLQEGKHYSVRPDQQVVGERTVINTRFAKVLIGNQIKHGSTYSDLVQQFLHVRLNEAAVKKGEPPNFFVEPDSTIALSSNAKYTLKKYYSKIEGCTGTAGNEEDLKQYEEVFGITHVVKLPSHEELRTKFLGAIYSASRKQQVSDILDHLLGFDDRPILITCEDDIEVKKLYDELLKEIQRRAREDGLTFDLSLFIKDTNDSGLAESDVVPHAGAAGKITISSRMGRGTDIKPETEAGLMVLRTYPALPQIAKQELGRQGRNGAQGTCIDIINYDDIRKEFSKYSDKESDHHERLVAIMNDQALHLRKKFQKHDNIDSHKWKWLEEGRARDFSDRTSTQMKDLAKHAQKHEKPAELQEHYLQARSLEQLRYELKKKNEVYLRRKEFLIATLSGDVIDVMHTNFDNWDEYELQRFQENWLDCRKKIESLWSTRLAGKAGDSEEVYKDFADHVAEVWEGFCLQYSDLNKGLFLDLAKYLKKNSAKLDGPDEVLLKFIKDQIEILTLQNDQNKPVTPADLEELAKIKKKLRGEIYLKYHPDKRDANTPNYDAALIPLYDHIIHQANELKDRVEEAIRRGKAQNKVAEPVSVHKEAHEQHESLREGSVSALVVHTGLKAKDKATLKDDKELKSLITFYQEWVKGADNHYFKGTRVDNEIVAAIYGNSGEYLDYFFEAVYKVSLAGDKTKTEQLFTALTKLSQPQWFLIPAKNIADTIVLLSEKFPDDDYGHYLECLNAFFNLDVFKDVQPKLAQAEDLTKYGLLHEIVMQIASNKYIATDDRNTLELMTNLSHILHRHFWKDLDKDLAQDLITLFTYSPEITALLTEKKLEGDLHLFIDLINQNKGALTKIRAQRIIQLGEYLLQHHQELADQRLGVMRPLFQIVLGETTQISDEAVQEPHLPMPTVLRNLPKGLQQDFWNFISQRQPVSEKDLSDLVDILKDGIDTPDFKERIFAPLIALPPYVSVEYIVRNLKGKISQTNYADAQRAFIQLEDAAKAFNAFVHQVGLIASDRRFSHKADESYTDYVTLFNQMTPEQNKLFFELCAHKRYAGASLKSIKLLGDALSDGTITGGTNALNTYLMLAVDISKLPKECQSRVEEQFNSGLKDLDEEVQEVQTFITKTKGIKVSESMITALWEALDKADIKTEKELDLGIHFMKKAHESTLEEDDVLDVFSAWSNAPVKDELLLDQTLTIMQEIAALQAKHKEVTLLEQFMASSKDAELRARYLEFFAAIKGKEINGPTLKNLAVAWFNHRIPGLNLLKNSIKAIHSAQDLQTNSDWKHYFMHLSQHAGERQSIMKLLHHGILDLGSEFSDRCFDEYKKMVAREIKVPQVSSSMDLSTRRKVLTSGLRKVFAFTDEITRIDKEIVNTNGHDKVTGKLQGYRDFFADQQKIYNKEWFRNQERKEQATLLFSNLSSIKARPQDDRANFFKEALMEIWRAQTQILESDKDTKRNKKGYSRLYDITVQMTIHLANELIQDPQISITDKLWLNESMQEQMPYHIQLLGNRLPAGHKHKALFSSCSKEEMHAGSTDLVAFEEGIRQVSMDSIPKNLRYLMTNIECFVDINEQSRQLSANKENMSQQSY
ncbi:MAG: hypothetical protein ACRCXC_02055 [Legionella sp.]